ncbi:MAG: putative metalloprotease CJM1_0395 family protein [Candidatus Kapabacteria bacterium]|nr:putative metalloprotease CJM1_0395 family protein [Candidatus Kapabacteria bacterium]
MSVNSINITNSFITESNDIFLSKNSKPVENTSSFHSDKDHKSNEDTLDKVTVNTNIEVSGANAYQGMIDSFKQKNLNNKLSKDYTPRAEHSDSNSTPFQSKPLAQKDDVIVEQLKKIDFNVRSHEMAHVAAGGNLIRGGPTFTFTKGPDGNQYAVSGEVQIDMSVDSSNPNATIQKMQQVIRAALAPPDPSPQDRSTAALATTIQVNASAELNKKMAENIKGLSENSDDSTASEAIQPKQKYEPVIEQKVYISGQTHSNQPVPNLPITIDGKRDESGFFAKSNNEELKIIRNENRTQVKTATDATYQANPVQEHKQRIDQNSKPKNLALTVKQLSVYSDTTDEIKSKGGILNQVITPSTSSLQNISLINL